MFPIKLRLNSKRYTRKTNKTNKRNKTEHFSVPPRTHRGNQNEPLQSLFEHDNRNPLGVFFAIKYSLQVKEGQGHTGSLPPGIKPDNGQEDLAQLKHLQRKHTNRNITK